MDRRQHSEHTGPHTAVIDPKTKAISAPDRRERPLAAALVWDLPRGRGELPVATERHVHRPRTCQPRRRADLDPKGE